MCRAKRIVNLHRSGMAACQSGDLDGALGKLRQALEEVRQIGLECYQVKIMNNLGIVLELKGDNRAAREHYRAAHGMARGKLGPDSRLCQVVGTNLARVS